MGPARKRPSPVKRRVGIFGGAFNPVHLGHLLVARAAKEALGLDELLFVPCNRSAYGKKLLPAKARLRMLEAALKGQAGLGVSDTEIRRGGISRSIDTLLELRRKQGAGTDFFLLIGEDQVSQFPSWKDAQQLSKLSQICVMARPGFKKSDLIHKKFHFRTVRVPQYEISSSDIRRRRSRKMALSWLVPESVLEIYTQVRS
jgi:nicotinate-nucleotide adenylyltransferase